MALIRELVTIVSATPPVRSLGALVRRRLRKWPGLDGYEKKATSKFIGLFAIGERSTIAILRNGIKVRVNTDDLVGRVLYAMGDYQPRVSWVIRQLLAPGDIVLDIGANVGWFVGTAAPLVGPTGRVVAFEPQPAIAAMLRETIAINGLDHVELHQVALSDKDGEATFHVMKGNSGAARLGGASFEGDWAPLTVQTRNAAEVLAELRLGPVRMIKIDVEGHEETVIRASQSYLDRNPPDIVLFESLFERQTFYERPLVRLLRSMGYRFFEFEPARLEVRLREVPADGGGTGFSNDFVALREGDRFEADLRRLGLGSAALARPAGSTSGNIE